MDQLPSILAFVGVFITVIVNLVLGIIKSRHDKTATSTDAEGEFQERLLKMVDAQDEKLKKQDERIEELQKTVDTLRTDNRRLADEKYTSERKVFDLQADLVKFERRVRELESELAKFERKVFRKDNDTL